MHRVLALTCLVASGVAVFATPAEVLQPIAALPVTVTSSFSEPIAFAVPYTYVYDAAGDKIRTVQFGAGGRLIPRSLFFAEHNRVLVTPGCLEFSSK
jgi:hypothetical protein